MSPTCTIVGIAAVLLLGASASNAQLPKDTSGESMAKMLKPLLIDAMPATLYEKTDNWGHQVMVPVGVKWRGIKPQVTKALRNHGEWKKLDITSQELPRSLDLTRDVTPVTEWILVTSKASSALKSGRMPGRFWM